MLRCRWVLVAIAGLVFVTFEVGEHWIGSAAGFDGNFVREVVIFGVLGPLAMGAILTLLAQSWSERLHAAQFMAQQQELSQRLASFQGWHDLAAFVVNFPHSLVPIVGATLFVQDRGDDSFQVVAEWWAAAEQEAVTSPWFHVPGFCSACAQAQTSSAAGLRSCYCVEHSPTPERITRYSMPLIHGEQPVALLYLYFPAGFVLSAEQIERLNSIAAPMAVAIGSARPERSAAIQSEAVEAERQRIARDLHDTLGQSLGFLHFKLDQLAADGALHEIDEIRQELERMRDVANEAYVQVRGTLVELKSAGAKTLGAALLKQARSVGERAHFQARLHSRGQPETLSPYVQRQILYLLREALTNVEKHANARQVEIDLVWTDETLTLLLSDDGQGFEPDKLVSNGHFGLEIMRERASEIDGQLAIQSAPGMGTTITLSLPLNPSPKSATGVV